MSDSALLEALDESLRQLDDAGDSSVTSVRLPTALRDALGIAVQLGLDASANDATVQALRDRIEVFAQRQALEAHYEEHPDARPTLVDLGWAAAQLAEPPVEIDLDVLEQAAAELQGERPDAGGDEVLAYALALRRHLAPA